MLIQEVIGQFRCKDRSAGHLAQFYQLHRQLLAGEIELPLELVQTIQELARYNKRLVRFRLATPLEQRQLGSAEPMVLMDPSAELGDVLARARQVRADKERPPSRQDLRRFVR